jgi:hypothetical protein
MTKLELVALELLKANYTSKEFEDYYKEEEMLSIKCAYDMAELFCSYIEGKLEQEIRIIS